MNLSNRKRAARGAALAAAFTLLTFAAAPGALAASSEQIVKECLRNGSVDPGSHSRGELQRALDTMPSDVAEYTDCYDVIAEALDAKRRRGAGDGGGDEAAGAGAAGGAAGGGGTGPPPSVQESGKARNEIETTLKRPPPTVGVSGRQVKPTIEGLKPANARNELPLPILLTLIAFALTLAAGGLLALRRKLPALRRALANTPLRLDAPGRFRS